MNEPLTDSDLAFFTENIRLSGLGETPWGQLVLEIIAQAREANALRSMAPYVEDSGHYCDGMTHAWTDAQIALNKQVDAENEARALRAENARLRTCVDTWKVEEAAWKERERMLLADLACARTFLVHTGSKHAVVQYSAIAGWGVWQTNYQCAYSLTQAAYFCATYDEALALARQWVGEEQANE